MEQSVENTVVIINNGFSTDPSLKPDVASLYRSESRNFIHFLIQMRLQLLQNKQLILQKSLFNLSQRESQNALDNPFPLKYFPLQFQFLQYLSPFQQEKIMHQVSNKQIHIKNSNAKWIRAEDHLKELPKKLSAINYFWIDETDFSLYGKFLQTNFQIKSEAQLLRFCVKSETSVDENVCCLWWVDSFRWKFSSN